ncbi:MAG: hypothetical protein LC792_18700 [Actinobacteria bacterium]|nr:hypothetical protein [Actinomycetota bacterium]
MGRADALVVAQPIGIALVQTFADLERARASSDGGECHPTFRHTQEIPLGPYVDAVVTIL